MNLTGRGPLGQKAPKKKPDRDRMAKIAAMPCVICENYGEAQISPTKVHHIIHGRYGRSRSADALTIPLCCGHHQGILDTSKVALHREPAEWQRLYGMDYDWLGVVNKRIG